MAALAYRTKGGETVDEVCWRHYGKTSGAVEYVLEMNIGLCSLGATLPAGIVISLPALPVKQTTVYDLVWS